MKPRTQKVRDKLWVQWRGRLFEMPVDLRKAQRAARGEETQELVAPFSCKVLKLSVKNGQAVKKGDAVVVVEAMKMEYSYASPRDGTIADVLVREGEIVQGGAPFVKWKA
ncbi:MAG: acetyl-CoA carboxylase biotin carboxyl carrier protein subunit [Bdellovibrionota bacterium]